MNLKNTFSRIVICLLLTLSTIICNNPFYQIKAIAANNEAISTDTDTWNYEQIVSDDPINLLPVLEEVIDSINNKDWFRFTSYMTDEQEAFFDWYFSNNYYNNGIKQIEQIQIRNAVLLNKNAVETELLYDEYPSMKQSEELHPYLVSLDCTVSEENVFFYNGTNYFLFVIEKTSDGTYKVAQFNRASYELSYLVEENSKSGIDTSEKKGLNVLKRAEQGLITNASGRILNEGCNLKQIKTKSITTKNTGISFSNYSEHTKLEGGFFISIPTEISVKLNSGKIVTPTLASYIKNTLPNEWYGSDDKDALIAGYFCVKGVALYRSLRPIYVKL